VRVFLVLILFGTKAPVVISSDNGMKDQLREAAQQVANQVGTLLAWLGVRDVSAEPCATKFTKRIVGTPIGVPAALSFNQFFAFVLERFTKVVLNLKSKSDAAARVVAEEPLWNSCSITVSKLWVLTSVAEKPEPL
jgi:hypothetical protein